MLESGIRICWAMVTSTMKAVRAHARGGAEVLSYEDVPCPKLGPHDALVRVGAAAITPAELTWSATWETREGTARLPSIPAHDVSGRVAELGNLVTGVKVGDPVYALTDFYRDGAAAEYVAVAAADLAPRPSSLDHLRAAAVPLSALTAWQGLFEHAKLSSGQRVLIHGAAGGVGSYAVQLAHWSRAHVLATASGADCDFVLELGADEFYDYRTERFDEHVRGVDIVFDTVGGETLVRSWPTLRAGGTLVSIVEKPRPPDPAREVHAATFIVEPNRSQLVRLGELIESGQLGPVVDLVLPLSRAREAFERGQRRHRHGKIVLAVEEELFSPRAE